MASGIPNLTSPSEQTLWDEQILWSEQILWDEQTLWSALTPRSERPRQAFAVAGRAPVGLAGDRQPAGRPAPQPVA
jgi:hypothetical protein